MKKLKKRIVSPSKLTIVLGFIFFNLIGLDFFIIKSLIPNTSVLGETTGLTATACPKSCVDRINQLLTVNSTSPKETFIPLGSGSAATDDWQNVPGAQVYIDSTQYRKIKKATFEATIEVPTGNQTVWVRLFNVSDKHPVWFSEVSMEGSGPTLLTSQSIALDPGNKQYQVQIKTQLRYQANLTQSRIHVTTY